MISNHIDQEIKQAMLAKDRVTLRGLRAIKAAFLLAKTEKSGLEELTEQAEIKILQKLVKQRKESADIYKNQRRDDLLRIEQEEIEVISKFLPVQLSHSDIEKAIEQIISQTDAASIKDIGKVMGLANKDLAGRAESKLIGEIVKQKLASL